MININRWVIEFCNKNKLKYHKKYSLNLQANIIKDKKFWIINLKQIRIVLKEIYLLMKLKVQLQYLKCLYKKIYKVIMIKE